MKRMTIEDLADHVRELVVSAPKGQVLLTRKGKPFAIVSDASNLDEEDLGYITSPEFWHMITERRRDRGGVPLEQIEARLGISGKQQQKKQPSTKSKKRNR